TVTGDETTTAATTAEGNVVATAKSVGLVAAAAWINNDVDASVAGSSTIGGAVTVDAQADHDVNTTAKAGTKGGNKNAPFTSLDEAAGKVKTTADAAGSSTIAAPAAAKTLAGPVTFA